MTARKLLLVLALVSAQASADQFGANGIAFDQPATVIFTLDPWSLGGGAFELQIYDVTAVPADFAASENKLQQALAGSVAATLFQIPGAAPGATANYTFQPGHQYALGAHFIPSNRGFVYAYSTNSLNGFANPYAGVSGSTQYFLFFPQGSQPAGPVAQGSGWQAWQSADLGAGPATVLLAVPGDPQRYYASMEARRVCVPLMACPSALDCGQIADGCGGFVTCGTREGACASGLECGGNVCGCSATPAPVQSQRGDLTCDGAGPAAGTSISGNLIVPAGAVCSLNGVTISGNVQVNGGSLFVQSSNISGNVQAHAAGAVSLDACTRVGGNFQASGAGGLAIAGDIHGNLQISQSNGSLPGGNTLCSASIGGNLEVQQGSAAAQFDIGSAAHCASGNAIAGNAQFQQNAGAIEVTGNTVGGNLQCAQNAALTASGNQVGKNDQCEVTAGAR